MVIIIMLSVGVSSPTLYLQPYSIRPDYKAFQTEHIPVMEGALQVGCFMLWMKSHIVGPFAITTGAP